MDAITDFLINYGYWGMFISAFLAGSIFPLSSEAVILALMASGLAPAPLVIYATVGNVIGGMFNYLVGSFGRLEWIERYLHVKREKLDRAQRFMDGHGAWMGFFSFLPVIGEGITISLGLMRANVIITIVSITAGKALRYILLVYGVDLLL